MPLPSTEYIRFEHELTEGNLISEVEVRWLSRSKATDIAFPGNDFWLFDKRVVPINHFNGNGQPSEAETIETPEVAKLRASAFEATWKRVTLHQEFNI